MNGVLSIFIPSKDFVYKIIAWMLALSSITGGVLLPQPVYYFALAILGFRLIAFGRLRFSNVFVLLLLFVCVLSLSLNSPPPFFRAWQRLGVYSLVLIVASPMLSSTFASAERYKVLMYFIYICVVLSVGSFFAYYLGINLFIRNNVVLDIGVGTFAGLTNHSMVLGPISALSAVYLFAKLLETKDSTDSRRGSRIIIIILAFLLCIGSCLLSASRAALGSLFVGCVFVLSRVYRARITRMLGVLFVAIVVATATYPLWESLASYVAQKNQGNIENGSILYSRETRIEGRVAEFMSSPIYGVGYCVMDPQHAGVDIVTGQIEPGSSWLAIASMTGILGLLCFIPICLIGLRKVWKIPDPFKSSVLGGMLAFFLVHMFAEGYIFAPKSFLSLLFWLILASINDQ